MTITNPATSLSASATVVSATRSVARLRNDASVRSATSSSGTLPRWPSRQPAAQTAATAGESAEVAGRSRTGAMR